MSHAASLQVYRQGTICIINTVEESYTEVKGLENVSQLCI